MSSGDGKRRRVLSEEERVLWTAVTKTIAPLKDAPPPENVETYAAPPGRPGAPIVKSSRTAPPIAEKKAPPPLAALGRRAKQRVARGKEPIDGRLDLHGLTQREAHATLLRFLHAAPGSFWSSQGKVVSAKASVAFSSGRFRSGWPCRNFASGSLDSSTRTSA